MTRRWGWHQVSHGAGVPHFIVHARKAILGGLSPAQNRNIPPLKYDFVYRLVKDFPDVDFTLNGGVNTYEEVRVASVIRIRARPLYDLPRARADCPDIGMPCARGRVASAHVG